MNIFFLSGVPVQYPVSLESGEHTKNEKTPAKPGKKWIRRKVDISDKVNFPVPIKRKKGFVYRRDFDPTTAKKEILAENQPLSPLKPEEIKAMDELMSHLPLELSEIAQSTEEKAENKQTTVQLSRYEEEVLEEGVAPGEYPAGMPEEPPLLLVEEPIKPVLICPLHELTLYHNVSKKKAGPTSNVRISSVR